MGQTEGEPADDRPRTLADLIEDLRAADVEADRARERANGLLRRVNLALARSGPVACGRNATETQEYAFDGERLWVRPLGPLVPIAEEFDEAGRSFEER